MFSSTKYDSFEKLKQSMKEGTSAKFNIKGTIEGKEQSIGTIVFELDNIKQNITDPAYSFQYIDVKIVPSDDDTDEYRLFEFTNPSIDESLKGLKIYNGILQSDTVFSGNDINPLSNVYLVSVSSMGSSMRSSMGSFMGSFNRSGRKLSSLPAESKIDINSTKPIDPNSAFYQDPNADNNDKSAPSMFSRIGSSASSLGSSFRSSLGSSFGSSFGSNKSGGKTRRRGKTQKRKRSKKSRKTKSKK